MHREKSESSGWIFQNQRRVTLKTFDLPDCYRVLQKKELWQIEPWGANAQPVLRTGKEIRFRFGSSEDKTGIHIKNGKR